MKRILIAASLTALFYQAGFSQINSSDIQSRVRPGIASPHENINQIYSNHLMAYSFIAQTRIHNHGIGDSTPAKMNDSLLAEQYLKKGRSYEITGIVLLGVGLGACIGGIAGYNHTTHNLENDSWVGYGILFVAGVALTITGTALLVGGLRRKKKARLLMQSENVSSYYHIPVKGQMYSVGFAFNLRRK